VTEAASKTPDQIANERMRALADALWNDKELGAKVQAKAKEMFPDAKTTHEVVEPWVGPLREENSKLAKMLEEMREERAAEKKAAEQSKSESSFKDVLEKVRRDYGLTDEGLDKVVERMKTAGAYDAEAAAAWVARQTPAPAAPGPTWAPQHLDLFGSRNKDEAMAQLHNNPQDYMDTQLSEFVRDPDKYVQETFGGRAA
jgi:hypothetical protein